MVVDQILDNEIDLDPEYQRSQSASSLFARFSLMIATPKMSFGQKRSKLVSSTLFSVTFISLPSYSVCVFIAIRMFVALEFTPTLQVVKPGDEGPDIRTCIDGKQRLTSIYRFMSGFVRHSLSHASYTYKLRL